MVAGSAESARPPTPRPRSSQAIFLVIVADAAFSIFFSIWVLMAVVASTPRSIDRGPRAGQPVRLAASCTTDLDLDVYRGEVLGRRRRLGHRQVGAAAHHRRAQPAGGGHDRGLRRRRRAMRRTPSGDGRAALGGVVPGRRAVLLADASGRTSRCRCASSSHLPSPLMRDELARSEDRRWSACRPTPPPKFPSRALGRHAQARRASPGRWRSIPRSSSSTSRPPGSTRSAPRPSTT